MKNVAFAIIGLLLIIIAGMVLYTKWFMILDVANMVAPIVERIGKAILPVTDRVATIVFLLFSM